MDLEQGMFAVKLCQMQREYGLLQSRLQTLQSKDKQRLCQEKERLQDEYEEQALLLDETARASRCPAMAGLARLQRDYNRQAQQQLQAAMQNGTSGTNARQRAETMALYAEFAMDLATQNVRYALLAALQAMEFENETGEQSQKEEHGRYE